MYALATGRAEKRVLIGEGGGGGFIYSRSARRISFQK